ncbi:sensor histidine kinase [Aristophania vespae]|uniref:sensor histidine kinase n=1 Tax=Aristophania vespae TaxID=2697033 RepID=UPI0023517D4C|nr:HAMP domain-containing sensor histidine kinase [Aristophania vespae]
MPLSVKYWISPFLGRILLLNIVPLLFLAGLLLYLNQYQRGLLNADVMALREEARIYARALEIFAGQDLSSDKAALNAKEARVILDKLMEFSFNSHIKLYGPNGELITNIRHDVPREHESPTFDDEAWSHSHVGTWRSPQHNFIDTIYDWILLGSFKTMEREVINFNGGLKYDDQKDKEFQIKPMRAEMPPYIRRNSANELIITIAEPVVCRGITMGELQLTRRAPEVDRALYAVRSSILTLMLLAIGVTILLSWYFSLTIARPLLQLVQSSRELRNSGKGRNDAVPRKLLERKDEVGSLARALRTSTLALWSRIDGTERFAAEVAHEVKNPLASLSSALEILPRINKPEERDRLIKILRDDVRRLERLVRDVADASRIEGELSRGLRESVYLKPLLSILVEMHQATRKENDPVLILNMDSENFWVYAVEDRLVQVIRNLVGNAVSFSPPNGKVTIGIKQGVTKKSSKYVQIIIEDEGPGIEEDKLELIFERFYSERPVKECFGQHSGLGLAISRQIIQTLDGDLYAENRVEFDSETGKNKVLGARFIICLPGNSQKTKKYRIDHM